MFTESEKTQLSYLLVTLVRQPDKKLRHKTVELIEKANGPFSPNVSEVLALVMAALDYE